MHSQAKAAYTHCSTQTLRKTSTPGALLTRDQQTKVCQIKLEGSRVKYEVCFPYMVLTGCLLLQTPKEFPFDDLKEELGGGFGPQALEERMKASIAQGGGEEEEG